MTKRNFKKEIEDTSRIAPSLKSQRHAETRFHAVPTCIAHLRVPYIRISLYETRLRPYEEENKKFANVIRFSSVPEDEAIRGQAGRRVEMKEGRLGRVGIAGFVRSSIPAKQGHLSGSA